MPARLRNFGSLSMSFPVSGSILPVIGLFGKVAGAKKMKLSNKELYKTEHMC
jgi:hypothetical protein